MHNGQIIDIYLLTDCKFELCEMLLSYIPFWTKIHLSLHCPIPNKNHMHTAPSITATHTSLQPDSTRDQDLRAFIAQRREERNKQGKGGRYGHYDNDSESSEDEKERVSTSLSSVVKIMKRCIYAIIDAQNYMHAAVHTCMCTSFLV